MGRKELQVMSSNQSVNEFLDEMEFKRDAQDFSVNEDSVEAYEYNLMLKGDMIGMYDESDMNRVAEGIEEEDDEFMEPDEIEEIDSKMAL
jgi:nicotinamide mononucleotide adenylyltransferase